MELNPGYLLKSFLLYEDCIKFHEFSGQKGLILFGKYHTKTTTVLRRKAPNVFEKIQLKNLNRFVILFPSNQLFIFVQKMDRKPVIVVCIKQQSLGNFPF